MALALAATSTGRTLLADDAEKAADKQQTGKAAALQESPTDRPARGDDQRPPPWHDRHGPPGGPGQGPPHGPHGHHHRFGDLRQSDPEMAKLYDRDAELDRRSSELGDQYRRTTDSAQRGELLAKLKSTVTEHFEVRQQRRELELKRLEEQLDRLRSGVKKRSEQKDEIIKQRLDELVGKPDDAGF
jgi:hypothetical protein